MKSLRERLDALPSSRQSKVIQAGMIGCCLDRAHIERIINEISDALQEQEKRDRYKGRRKVPTWVWAKRRRAKQVTL
jgi:hypothetical protein